MGHGDRGRGTVGAAPTSSGGPHLPVWGGGSVCHEPNTSSALPETATWRQSHCAAHEQGCVWRVDGGGWVVGGGVGGWWWGGWMVGGGWLVVGWLVGGGVGGWWGVVGWWWGGWLVVDGGGGWLVVGWVGSWWWGGVACNGQRWEGYLAVYVNHLLTQSPMVDVYQWCY